MIVNYFISTYWNQLKSEAYLAIIPDGQSSVKKYTLLFFLIISITLTGYSQDTTRNKLTLNQCIDIAFRNNVDVQQKMIDVERLRINWQQARANMLPSINSGITHGLNRGRSIDPFTNTYINQEIGYATPYLEGSLLLFNGRALSSLIKQRSFIYQATKQEEQQAKDELTLEVILSYLEVLTNQDLSLLAKSRYEITAKQVERLETLNKSGAVSPGEYYDLKGQYASDQLSVINAKNLLENSKLDLVRKLNIPYSKNLSLESLPADELLLTYDTDPEKIYQLAIKNLASVKAAELRKKSADMALRSSKANYFPSIYFNTGISSSFSNAARDAFNQPIGYFTQFNNNQRRFFSISISVPLLNSFRAKNSVSLAKLSQRESELASQQIHTQLQQLTQQAYLNLIAAKDRRVSLEEQVKSYTASFKAAEARFNAGVINSVDYLIAKGNLDRSQINMVTIGYDIVLRKKIIDFYEGK
jgi:outer membrane protein